MKRNEEEKKHTCLLHLARRARYRNPKKEKGAKGGAFAGDDAAGAKGPAHHRARSAPTAPVNSDEFLMIGAQAPLDDGGGFARDRRAAAALANAEVRSPTHERFFHRLFHDTHFHCVTLRHATQAHPSGSPTASYMTLYIT